MERPDERDGKSGPEDHSGSPLSGSTARRSVLDQAPGEPEKISALRWLLVVVPLLVIVLAGGCIVRSVLDRLPSSVIATPESRRDPSPPKDAKLPSFPDGATQPPLQPAFPVSPRKADEPWPFDAAAVVSRIAGADLHNGRTFFKLCEFCHTAEPAGGHRLGPALWNIMGREKASYSDYAYSQALKAQGSRWTYEDMARYLYDTRSAVPGGKMSFAGIKDPARLADVIAFMRTLSDKPVPLPMAR